MTKATNKAYDERLDTMEGMEGEKTLQRHQARKDVQQVRVMKDKVMTDEKSVLIIWKEYYIGLMNGENESDGK